MDQVEGSRLALQAWFISEVKQHLEDRASLESPYNDELHLKISQDDLLGLVTKMSADWGFNLIQLLAVDEREIKKGFGMYYVFSLDAAKFVVILSYSMDEHTPKFESITPIMPAAHWYEREIKDYFGLNPKGHPDLRRLALHKDWPKGVFPMRRDFSPQSEVRRIEGDFNFHEVQGEGVMQIPVGPIHAGIIEPGHFRFSTVGEHIINLEAQLFYTHRGMEKRIEGQTPEQGLLFAERICGACSFSHASSYCMALEKLTGTIVPERAKFVRTAALELERLYNHVGDVGNICAGVGLAFGTMHGTRMKEDLFGLNEEVFGSRFLRGINIPGGIRRDIDAQNAENIIKTLRMIERDFQELSEILLSTESFMDRVENTGILKPELAAQLHAVGPAARAAGVDRDTRRDLPYAAYDKLTFKVPLYSEGDVLARLKMRIDEVFVSIEIIRQVLKLMGPGSLKTELGAVKPYSYAVGITESPRGENVHFVMGGPDGTIYRHMVRSPSYCNWPVLPTTVPGNIVPDFPLINKSFELCYSCLDR